MASAAQIRYLMAMKKKGKLDPARAKKSPSKTPKLPPARKK